MIARSTFTPLLALSLFSAGCSTFSRSNPEAEKAAGNEGKNTYSAVEGGTDLKEQKIIHLESTVTTLNSRIQELEGKLQAAQAKPTSLTSTQRQFIDAEALGSKIRATVAGNDPGAGFVNDASVRAFQQGKLLFDQEKFPESILAFSAFLETNPNHALASSAQYYIGENYYRQGDYAVADQEFQKLALRYPHSARTSYALVRLSQSTGMLGKTEESKRYRVQVEGLFPKSPALKLFNEKPTTSPSEMEAKAPIQTAPEIRIENPSIPTIQAPTIETPSIQSPSIDTPRVEAPTTNAPRARISGEDRLDAPPGAGG